MAVIIRLSRFTTLLQHVSVLYGRCFGTNSPERCLDFYFVTACPDMSSLNIDCLRLLDIHDGVTFHRSQAGKQLKEKRKRKGHRCNNSKSQFARTFSFCLKNEHASGGSGLNCNKFNLSCLNRFMPSDVMQTAM